MPKRYGNYFYLIQPLRRLWIDELVFEDLCDLTRTYSTTTLADSETKALVQSYCVDELNLDLYVVTRHYHLNSLWKLDLTCTVHSTEVELRTILVAERCVTTTLFLLQNVDRSLEVLVRLDLTRVAKYHTALDLVLIDTTEEKTYVIASFTLVENLTEHLNTSNDTLLILTEAKELCLVAYLNATSLDTTSSNSTTTCD